MKGGDHRHQRAKTNGNMIVNMLATCLLYFSRPCWGWGIFIRWVASQGFTRTPSHPIPSHPSPISTCDVEEGTLPDLRTNCLGMGLQRQLCLAPIPDQNMMWVKRARTELPQLHYKKGNKIPPTILSMHLSLLLSLTVFLPFTSRLILRTHVLFPFNIFSSFF